MLKALDTPNQATEFKIEMLPMGKEGLRIDQLDLALKAHPDADAIVSLIGPPHRPRDLKNANPEKIPLYAICLLETRQVVKMGQLGMITALVPRETNVDWHTNPPENTHEAIFNAYCAVHSKTPKK